MSEDEVSLPKPSKLPENSAFKQQRLPARQPVYTAKSVLPVFLSVSAIFCAIGAVLLITSWGATEYSYDYTNCQSLDDPSVQCSSLVGNSLEPQPCTCTFNLNVNELLAGNVFFYYGLDDFYQNHRRYVKSRDDNQLIGRNVDANSVDDNCAPYDVYRINGEAQVYAPCGAIANSLFNDTYTVMFGNLSVPLLKTGIAWPSDHSEKFNNPPGDIALTFSGTRKPRFWQTPVQFLDNSSDLNNGYQNEALIVWMRTAAFPRFRKLYGRLNRQEILFQNGLPPGTYTIQVSYNYPVTGFGGRKRFIMATTTWMGGKNDFLGVAYICAGILSAVLSVILWAIHLVGRKMQIINVRPTN